MPSPFPGMDPYLEGPLWPDVHQALATAIRRQIAPRLRPRYVARLNVRVVKDMSAEAEIGIAYPDIGVFRRRHPDRAATPPSTEFTAITPATSTISAYAVEVRLVTVEVRDTDTNRLVTAVELLSPVNKRGQGLRDYRRKRQRMRDARVHLLEIDLLRRGTRVVPGSRVPKSDYLVSLTRAGRGATDLWSISMRDKLPVLPIPLRNEEDDLPLDLKKSIDELYDDAAYDLSIDYTQPPPPPELLPDDIEWARSLTQD